MTAFVDLDLDVARGRRPPFPLSGEDAEVMRAIRGRYTTGELDSFGYQFLPLLDGDTPFTVWARDTIPLEDANGRIRPPGYPADRF